MTVVNIDVSNVASSFHEDDKVIFYAPAHRSASGGGVTNTAPETVPLVGGKADVDLKPGPVLVRIQCRGIADTSEKQGTVPDAGPITLDDVLGDAYEYTPTVIGAVQEAALSATLDAARAEEAAERVGTAEQVGTWATQAETSAANAATSETNADGSAAAAAGSASSAATSETSAATSATASQEWSSVSEDAAAVAVVAAAEFELLQGTGSPDGVVAAHVGAIYTDTAATAGAVRWIKVSGTGATGWRVLYGDTGWVVADGWAINGWAGRLRARRIGDWVEVIVHALDPTAMTGNPAVLFPVGFRPYQSSGATVRPLLHESDNISTPRRFYFTSAGELATTTYAKPAAPVHGSFTYTTTEPWVTA